jgi:hypothetical protein
MKDEIEPIRGLPEALPPGERILWQGSPEWPALAVRALHIRKVAAYFGLLAAASVAASVGIDGTALPAALGSAAGLALPALAALGLLGIYAFLAARATVYTITDRRVVMRFGVALSLTVNIPFRIVGSAGLKLDRDGTGDIPLSLTGSGKIAYLALWPHARPWRVTRPEPMLRAVPDAARVGRILAGALAAAAGGTPAVTVQPEAAPEPAGPVAAAA